MMMLGAAASADPRPPPTENKLAAVSCVHTVFVPVNVIAAEPPAVPVFGETERVSTPVAVVPRFVPSATVSVPTPEPVVTTNVAAVALVIFWLTFVTPLTPDTVNPVLPLLQAVLLPVSVSVMLPE